MAWSRRWQRAGSATVKPWHRAVAAVVTVACLAGAVAIALDVHDDRVADWSKHLAGALLVLFGLGGLAAAIARPRPTLAVWAWLGWTMPVAVIWLGVEHWLDWHAFYDPSPGKARITTETGARIHGAAFVFIGLVAAWFWTVVARAERGARRAARSAS